MIVAMSDMNITSRLDAYLTNVKIEKLFYRYNFLGKKIIKVQIIMLVLELSVCIGLVLI
jgi:hypothetical protein